MSIMQNAVGANFTETFTAGTTVNVFPPFKLGTRMRGDDGSEWLFVQASGAITGAGYVCTVDENFQAAMLSTSNDAGGDVVGIAGTDFADNDYGWVQVLGPCVIRVAASCAANVGINTTATAGQLDDDGTAGSFDIVGLILTTANGGAAATAAGHANYPTIALAAN
jgi:hypothetical protein